MLSQTPLASRSDMTCSAEIAVQENAGFFSDNKIALAFDWQKVVTSIVQSHQFVVTAPDVFNVLDFVFVSST